MISKKIYIITVIALVFFVIWLFRPSTIPPQFYDVNNSGSVFYFSNHNNSCSVTSKVVNENVELTLPAYSSTIDLTKYNGEYTNVKGRVVYLKSDFYEKNKKSCRVSQDNIVGGILDSFMINQHYITAFIVEEIPASGSGSIKN